MAKLNKLKSMIKRLNSSGSSRCVSRTISGSSIPHNDDDSMWQQPSEEPKFGADGAVNEHLDVVPCGLHPVYVGKSRRRYLVSTDLIGHPLFSVLVKRSGGGGGTSSAVIVGCEVVLFEHLLWMLRNGDVHPELTPDDLVDFYAC
ncbi:auxin-responsive protein SAUR72-like [Ananas comosus]|uniref:Auxin-responsive protein SAUR72-like n=2 Tax=Ananas comosus TaxID=4615 RepID=A0A6P5F428_ANACO|nr:auxin-responsive protein SAUR72-like [Ananas comosus]